MVLDLSTLKRELNYFHEFNVSKQWNLWPSRELNPLTKNPKRYWSQSDEDGILEKIFNRIDPKSKVFIEFGCGDGLQNNTIALLTKGWVGGWIDGKDLQYSVPPGNNKLKFQKAWITCDNVVKLFKNATTSKINESIGLLSIDLDGNDYHFLEKILLTKPVIDVIVLEYNAKFPVGAFWVMPYKENHQWAGDDYFGASLSSFTRLLGNFGFKLMAASIQGSNAFYVNMKHLSKFSDVNFSEDQIYQPPLYYLMHEYAQTASPKTILSILQS